MTIEALIDRYGTDTISLTLQTFANRLRDMGKDIDIAVVNDMADALKAALTNWNEDTPDD